ncbi:hypothetical protein PSYJA_43381, partial [Pseudomonas syringae pv. japonica str. M301072]
GGLFDISTATSGKYLGILGWRLIQVRGSSAQHIDCGMQCDVHSAK